MSDWLDKHQFALAIGLIVFITLGGIVLLFEQQRNKLLLTAKAPEVDRAAWETERQNMEERIKNLEASRQGTEQVSAPTSGQVAGAQIAPLTRPTALPTASGGVNLNTANQAQLEQLPGIGAVRAQAIISYRQEHSGFKSIEELKEVSGIGESTFEKLQSLVTVK